MENGKWKMEKLIVSKRIFKIKKEKD